MSQMSRKLTNRKILFKVILKYPDNQASFYAKKTGMATRTVIRILTKESTKNLVNCRLVENFIIPNILYYRFFTVLDKYNENNISEAISNELKSVLI